MPSRARLDEFIGVVDEALPQQVLVFHAQVILGFAARMPATVAVELAFRGSEGGKEAFDLGTSGRGKVGRVGGDGSGEREKGGKGGC